jgi:hypothetical protein
MARYIGVILLAALALWTGEAYGDCAWVLWTKVYAKDMKEPTSGKADHSVEPFFHEPQAFATKEECDREARSQAAFELSLRHRSDVRQIEFHNCLPDTVDPRAPRGTR